VRNFYVDLERMPEVHPLVVSVTPTGRHDTDQGYRQSYRITDRIPFGRLSAPIRYRVELWVPRSGDVRAQSWQFPQVTLDTTISFEPDGDGTLLTERMQICAPRVLLRFTVHQAVDAHRQMLSAIAAKFERVSGV